MSDSIKNVETEYGPYSPLSTRLPKFLKEYSHHEGFGVEIDVVDPLSLKPGMLQLYIECIRAGRNFKAVGLPDLPSWRSLVFIAKLVRNGEVLDKASTHQELQFLKDYEIAETRARQRLVAACGFDGGALDLDEYDQSQRGAVPMPELDEHPENQDDEDKSSDPDTTVSSAALVVVDSPDSGKTELSPQLQSQVDARVSSLRSQGQDVTPPTTKREALSFLRDRSAGTGEAQ